MSQYIKRILLITLLFSGCVQMQAHAQAEQDGYLLGPGDHVQIRVFGEEDLTVDIRLNATGVVSYPFLGELQISGKTSTQVEQIIVDGLKPDFLINPVVNVSILEYRRFYIYGEVKTPGEYNFEPGMTLRKAIVLAGGFTERASRKNIEIVHEANPQLTEKRSNLDIPIAPGDVIDVQQTFF